MKKKENYVTPEVMTIHTRWEHPLMAVSFSGGHAVGSDESTLGNWEGGHSDGSEEGHWPGGSGSGSGIGGGGGGAGTGLVGEDDGD